MSKPTTKIVGHAGNVYIPAGTSAILSSFDADPDNKNPGLMEKFLEPLGGRRFQEGKDYKGDMVNVNIVVVGLPEEDRKKILENKGDEFSNDDGYSPILNGVEIHYMDFARGYPAGYDNFRFRDWKIVQSTRETINRLSDKLSK